MNHRVRAGSGARRLRARRGLLLHGDCLTLVPTLPRSERFDLVYVDPPFNTGRRQTLESVRTVRDECR